jgi:transcriptional regulator with XRE-family HTH domain
MARKREREPQMIVQLRTAIRDSGLSVSEIGRRSKVSQPQLSRFISGERTLTLPAAARLCEALGLRLVGPKRVRPRTK